MAERNRNRLVYDHSRGRHAQYHTEDLSQRDIRMLFGPDDIPLACAMCVRTHAKREEKRLALANRCPQEEDVTAAKQDVYAYQFRHTLMAEWR